MHILVTYASRHGATSGIAQRIAGTLRAAGHEAYALPVEEVPSIGGYDAVVVGGAAYTLHWLKEATRFVRRHAAELARKPVWLFSSGPLGTESTEADRQDQKAAAIPKELPELAELVHARGTRVFFGAYSRDRRPIGLGERLVAWMPATRDGLPEGDFRDWDDIEGWACEIAAALGPAAASTAPVSAAR